MVKKIIGAAISLSFLMTIGMVSLTQAVTPTQIAAKTVDIACLQAAVEKRETAIIFAWSSLNSSVTAALAIRKDALKTAWTVSDASQRKTAIKTAWTNFKSADKTARTTFRKSQKTAWEQFKVDAKACRATATNEEQGSDIQL